MPARPPRTRRASAMTSSSPVKPHASSSSGFGPAPSPPGAPSPGGDSASSGLTPPPPESDRIEPPADAPSPLSSSGAPSPSPPMPEESERPETSPAPIKLKLNLGVTKPADGSEEPPAKRKREPPKAREAKAEGSQAAAKRSARKGKKAEAAEEVPASGADDAYTPDEPVPKKKKRRVMASDSESPEAAPVDLHKEDEAMVEDTSEDKPATPAGDGEAKPKEKQEKRKLKATKSTEASKPADLFNDDEPTPQSSSQPSSQPKPAQKDKRPPPQPKPKRRPEDSPKPATGTPNAAAPAGPRPSLLASTLSRFTANKSTGSVPDRKEDKPEERPRAGGWGEEFVMSAQQQREYAAAQVNRSFDAAQRTKAAAHPLNLQEAKDAYAADAVRAALAGGNGELTDQKAFGARRSIPVYGTGIVTTGRPSEMVAAVLAGKARY